MIQKHHLCTIQLSTQISWLLINILLQVAVSTRMANSSLSKAIKIQCFWPQMRHLKRNLAFEVTSQCLSFKVSNNFLPGLQSSERMTSHLPSAHTIQLKKTLKMLSDKTSFLAYQEISVDHHLSKICNLQLSESVVPKFSTTTSL